MLIHTRMGSLNLRVLFAISGIGYILGMLSRQPNNPHT